MSQFLEQPELFDKIIHLSEEEINEPGKVIRNFYGNYHLHECRHIIWTMVETCLSTDHVNFCEAADRADLLTRARHIEELMEAAYLVFREGKEERGTETDAVTENSGVGK